MTNPFEKIGEKLSTLAPLDEDSNVPLANLPGAVGGAGGTGDGRPYGVLFLVIDQDIPDDTETTLEDWDQFGTTAVTFDVDNSKWQFPIAGLWTIEPQVNWQDNVTGLRAATLYRDVTLTLGGGSPATVAFACLNMSASAVDGWLPWDGTLGAPTLSGSTTQRVSDWDYGNPAVLQIEATADDWFYISARQDSGGALGIRGAGAPVPSGFGTTVVCTYIGVS